MHRLGLVVVAVGAWLAPLAAGAQPEPAMSELVVRVYDATGTTDTDRAAALDVAANIFRAADIGTRWPDCRLPRPNAESTRNGSDLCNRPMRSGELAVRLVRGTPPTRLTGPVELGYSLIDTTVRLGALATIYLDRVEWLADAADIDVRVLVGRAIAHEIGHLLLGTNAHGRSGLMRANWSREALQHGDATEWMFTRQERLGLQRAIGRRTPVTETADNIVWGNRK